MGGLVLAASALGVRRLDAAAWSGGSAADPLSPHAYIRIGDDGIVTIVCHRSEMGQGIRTTMPMIIADEMEADWTKCRVEQAGGDEAKYGSQNTDGSTSIRDFLPQYRNAGATARATVPWCTHPRDGASHSVRSSPPHAHCPCQARHACVSKHPPSVAGKASA